MNYTLKQRTQRLTADTKTPISLFLQLRDATPHALLLESAEVDGTWGRYSVLACDFWLTLRCVEGRMEVSAKVDSLKGLEIYNGCPFLASLKEIIAALNIESDDPTLAPITRGLYGYFGYETAALFQPKLAESISVHDAEAQLVLPASVFVFDHMFNKLTQISLGEHRILSNHFSDEKKEMKIGRITRTPGEDIYKQQVEAARQLLHEGEGIQVVLSTQAQADFEGDSFMLYRRMRQINPSPYMFYMQLEGLELFGSSPEVMVRSTANELRLCPIAGTRRRGNTPDEDAALAEELINDPKERAEHIMLVDLGRNDLGRIARPCSVKVKQLMNIERFSHVMHITSQVTATLKPELDALDLLASTFPAGTVSGAPKVRAMQMIADMEGTPRGPYAGCIGWIGLDKDSIHMDSGITIRSMWVRDGKLHWQAGAGIVFDSQAELEWQECLNKGKIIDTILASLD